MDKQELQTKLKLTLKDIGDRRSTEIVLDAPFSRKVEYIKISCQNEGNTIFVQGSNDYLYTQPALYRLPILLNFLSKILKETSSIIGSNFSMNFSLKDNPKKRKLLRFDGKSEEWLFPTIYDLKLYNNYTKYNRLDFDIKSFSSHTLDWDNRVSKLFWRGSTTGIGSWNKEGRLSTQRVKVCQQESNNADTDIKISNIVQCDRSEINALKCALIDQNLFSEKIEEKIFCNYKYYPDIPGNVLSWGTINKHLMGMLIIRPASKRKLMWHGLMKPWIHYIPCSSDFSDLSEKISWLKHHDEEAALIAWRGAQIAKSYILNLEESGKQALICNFEKSI